MARLGEAVTVDGRRRVVGGRADGVPTNGRLSSDAAPVAVFPAHQGYLELGGTPYHLVTRRKSDDGFEVSPLGRSGWAGRTTRRERRLNRDWVALFTRMDYL